MIAIQLTISTLFPHPYPGFAHREWREAAWSDHARKTGALARMGGWAQ